MASSPAEPPPPDHIGPYRIVRVLGEGGMGIVYLAEQERPVRRPVALKVVRLGLSSRDVLARFEAERQALAMMQHPNIATVFDAGTAEDGRPYFVMEYVDGVPITTYCDEHRLEIDERLRLFVPVCEGIHHAHQKGIVHRDVTPRNILVREENGHAMPKIIDFGIAKSLTQRLTDVTLFTQRQLLIGTPAYMPPEQAGLSAADVDTTADVYSLGVVFYELLAGALPFDLEEARRRGTDAMLGVILDQEPLRPSARVQALADAEAAACRGTDPPGLARRLRGDLDWIAMRAMEKERQRRYPAASDLAAEIQRHLAGEPVLAGPPSTVYRIRKLVRRHRAVFVGLVSVVAALALGLGVATAMYLRAEGARRVALWQSYLANVRAASTSIRELDVREAKRSLAACDPLLRGWEWLHLMHRADESAKVLPFPGSRVVQVSFTPDGHRIVATSGAGLIRTWDAQSGRMLATWADSSRGTLFLSVSPDGSRLATGGRDNMVRVRELASGRVLREMRGHTGIGIEAIAWSRNSRMIGSAGADNAVVLWDAATGRIMHRLGGFFSAPACVEFDPLDRSVVTGDSRSVLIWDVASGRMSHRFGEHQGVITSLAYSRDGRRLVEASMDMPVRILDPNTGGILRVLSGPGSNAGDVAIMPDGSSFATASHEKTVRVWSLRTGALLRTFVGHDEYVYSVDCSPDGRWLASTSDDETVRVWDLARPGNPETIWAADTVGIACLSCSPDGRWLAFGGSDGAIHFWSTRGGRTSRVLNGHTQYVTHLAFSPAGDRLASSSMDGSVRIWDVATGRCERTLTPGGGAQSAVAFDRSGRTVATGAASGSIQLWDLAAGRPARTLSYHRDSTYGRITDLAYSLDGRRLLSGSWYKGLLQWDSQSGDTLGSRGFGGWVSALAPAPDSRWIATGGWDAKVRLWDATTGRMVHVMGGHSAPVTALAVSPDGRRIVSASEDGTLRLWDPSTGEWLAALYGHTGPVRAVTFSPDGSEIYSAGDDGRVLVWRR